MVCRRVGMMGRCVEIVCRGVWMVSGGVRMVGRGEEMDVLKGV